MRAMILSFLLMLAPAVARAECVVLLHGLARSGASMAVLEQVLRFHGYHVVNMGYPSETAPIADLLQHVGRAAAHCGDQRLHFVTHSMGGILVRAWLAQGLPETLGRVVMLAPPNGGSEIVDTLRGNDLLLEAAEWLNGPAMVQLGTDPASVPNLLPPVAFELGVIAGNNTINPFGAALIDGPNDGTVSVASTRVDGMSDHVVIGANHTLITVDPIAMAEVLEFLRNGVFDHGITLANALRKLAHP